MQAQARAPSHTMDPSVPAFTAHTTPFPHSPFPLPLSPHPSPSPPRYVTELGRVASHYYVKAPSIVTFNERLKPHLREEDVLAMMALSSEFDSMAVRCACGAAAAGGDDCLRGRGGWVQGFR